MTVRQLMVRLLALLSLAYVASAAPLRAEQESDGPFELKGFASLRAGITWGQRSWLSDGFGRLTTSGNGAGAARAVAEAHSQAAFAWRPSDLFGAYLHVVARYEPDSEGDPLAVPEAYVETAPSLGPRLWGRIRLGTMYLPTSRENSDPLWASPYTLTFSAWNSWIAEEFRPTGLDVSLMVPLGQTFESQLGVTAFIGADTSGTLLAWRGWSFSDRSSGIGETLPVPPIRSLQPGGPFYGRQEEYSGPLDELDDHAGGAIRWRLESPGHALAQATYVDNGGDRGWYDGQYSWETTFTHVAAQAWWGRGWTMMAEAASGRTAMGRYARAKVESRFWTSYLLASWRRGKWRVSVRHDRFGLEDRDQSYAEPNGENGYAWTVAAMWRFRQHVRLGIELLDVQGDRAAVADAGGDPDLSAWRALCEVRAIF
ncbi:MAG: hypothetical protein HYV63_34290 [Candidatus Schekmanbacteria bacterium]|nr:hypothetical protein [Candidatus Schekmanbacteria bacterium]